VSLERGEKDFVMQQQPSEKTPAWVEASGWTINERDQVVLIAPPQQNGSFPQLVAATCTG
jgi:hypothetical protein